MSITFDEYGAVLGIFRFDGETFGLEPARLHKVFTHFLFSVVFQPIFRILYDLV